jgi:transcriptional regulator with XRE-family HTH domain
MGDFDLSGVVAAARRRADLSQRDLAARSGIPQSTVAAAESRARSVQVAVLVRLLEAAGLRLAVLDEDGAEVLPFDSRAARDNAGRRFPAHLDAAHPDEVDPYVSRPRYDRPTARRKAGFERREARDRRRSRAGEAPARHVTAGEVELRRLDRRYGRQPAYWARREAFVRELGVPADVAGATDPTPAGWDPAPRGRAGRAPRTD